MKKNKVLLVDDNLDMALIGQRMFADAGFAFDSVRTGAEGLEKLKSGPADLLILDDALSDLQGWQFLRALISEPEYAAVRTMPVILLSARPETVEDLRPFRRYGLRAVFTKPFGFRELVQVAETILQQEPWQTQKSPEGEAIRPSPAAAGNRDEVRWGLLTIAQLALDLKADMLDEQRSLDLEAIYTTSKRLQRLLRAETPAGPMLATEKQFTI